MFTRAIFCSLAVLAVLLISCSKEQKAAKEAPTTEPVAPEKAGSASASQDTALADQYYAAAGKFSKAAKHDSAIVCYKKASARYEAERDWEKYVRCYNQMGEQSWRKQALDEAMQYLNQALQTGLEHLGEQHPEIADCYQQMGIVYEWRGQYDQSLKFHQQALQIRLAKLGEQDLEVAHSYNNMGLVYWRKGEAEQAGACHKKALAIRLAKLGEQHTDVAASYNNLANVYYYQGNFDEAISSYEKASSIWRATLGEQHLNVAAGYNNIGNVYKDKGNFDQAIHFYEKALYLCLVLFGEQHLYVAGFYGNLGTVYSLKGDYDQALAFYGKALPIMRALFGEQHPEVAGIYSNMGSSYLEKGDYDRAIVFHEKALPIQLSVFGKDHPEVALTYDNLGIGYTQKSDYGQALTRLKKALAIRLAKLGNQHPDVAKSYSNMAKVYGKKGAHDQAIALYNKTLSIELATFGERHPEVAACYNNLGKAYQDRGEYGQALDFYQRALHANVPAFSDFQLHVNPPLHGILSENVLLESLIDKAQALAKRYAQSSRHLQDLEVAVSTYQLASQLIDQMRRGYKAEGSKLFLAEQATEIYGHAIQTALRLYSATQNQEHTHAAFSFAEKSKAGVMLEALSEAEAKQFAGIPDSLLARERQLRLDLAFYEKSLGEEQLNREGQDSSKIALWQDKVFGLKQAYDTMLQRFEKDYPDYYHLKYQTKTVSVPEVQRLLDDLTALVEYFSGKDSIFIFAITKSDFIIKTSAKDSLFAEQIAQLRQGLIKQEFAPYTQAAFRLYQTLLAPLKAGSMLDGKNLIIVPDGALSAIPFETLLTHAVDAEGGLKDYPKLPYLIEAHAMSYAYSATLLQQEQSRRKRETTHDYLAFAPLFPEGLPAGTRGADFIKENFAHDSSQTAPATATATRLRSFLPATKKEVTGIFDRFENSYSLFERWFGNRSRVYLEQEAKEEKLKSADLSSYRFLHFATHGLVNQKNPKLSGLILTQEDTASQEDGILHLGEIYNLHLNADLVVLSACETGLGQIAQGEGIIGLTRGFLYAGAKNVLVSLWQVSDMTTSYLMVDFYGNMLGGMSKAEALREAKLQMIRRDPGYARPYYWAPFILVGR